MQGSHPMAGHWQYPMTAPVARTPTFGAPWSVANIGNVFCIFARGELVSVDNHHRRRPRSFDPSPGSGCLKWRHIAFVSSRPDPSAESPGETTSDPAPAYVASTLS